MTQERVSRFEFDISAARFPDSAKWAAFLEIGMHVGEGADTEIIFPKQRVGLDEEFDSEEEAMKEARRFAHAHISSGEF